MLIRKICVFVMLLGAAAVASQALPRQAAPETSAPSKMPPCDPPPGSPQGAIADCGVVVKEDVNAIRLAPPSVPPTATAALVPTSDPAEIIRRVAAHEEENQKKRRNYTYRENVFEKKLDGQGQVKSTENSGFDIMMIYGEQVQRQVSKDGQPLGPKEAAKEEEKIDKLIAKYQHESPDEQTKRLEKEEKSREEARDFVKEIADAFNFTMLPQETVDGRALYVIQGEPKPGYEPRGKNGKFLTKFRGKLWIDQNDYRWVKADLETIDTISIGWFVARLHKGTHLYAEETRVNDEVWLPKLVHLNLDARIALFKELNEDVTQTYSDYKKFGAQTRIVTMGQEEKP